MAESVSGTNLSVSPHLPGERHQLVHHGPHLLVEAALTAEVSAGDHAEDLVDGALGGDGRVEDTEVTLETGRDVVPAASCDTCSLHQDSPRDNTYHNLRVLLEKLTLVLFCIHRYLRHSSPYFFCYKQHKNDS